MSGFVILLVVLMLLQSVLSVVQVKQYQSFIKKVTTEQAGTEYDFYTEVVKGRVMRTVVAVVVDKEGKVIQCYGCSGMTVFAKFKEDSSYQGMRLEEFYSKKVQESEMTKIEEGLSKIYSRKLEAVT
ncbi:transcriptional regulator GutM [Enterococcus sp. AZ109]|uniref:transcriptional regulator GutM n=1 Tax=Enterococcus sp. AZ109 TaxID=2774634 RepID=UPI003F1FDE3F